MISVMEPEEKGDPVGKDISTRSSGGNDNLNGLETMATSKPIVPILEFLKSFVQLDDEDLKSSPDDSLFQDIRLEDYMINDNDIPSFEVGDIDLDIFNETEVTDENRNRVATKFGGFLMPDPKEAKVTEGLQMNDRRAESPIKLLRLTRSGITRVVAGSSASNLSELPETLITPCEDEMDTGNNDDGGEPCAKLRKCDVVGSTESKTAKVMYVVDTSTQRKMFIPDAGEVPKGMELASLKDLDRHTIGGQPLALLQVIRQKKSSEPPRKLNSLSDLMTSEKQKQAEAEQAKSSSRIHYQQRGFDQNKVASIISKGAKGAVYGSEAEKSKIVIGKPSVITLKQDAHPKNMRGQALLCERCPQKLWFLLYEDHVFRKHMLITHGLEIREEDTEKYIRYAGDVQQCKSCRRIIFRGFDEHKAKCFPPGTSTLDAFNQIDLSKDCPTHKCGVCRKTFSMRCQLRAHVQETHASIASKMIMDPDFRCAQCLMKMKSSEQLSKHCLTCSDQRASEETVRELAQRLVFCDFCRKNHADINETSLCFLRRNSMFRCLLCLAIIKDKEYASEHMKTYHMHNLDSLGQPTPNGLQCPVCGLGPDKYTSIFPHLSREHYEPAYKTLTEHPPNVIVPTTTASKSVSEGMRVSVSRVTVTSNSPAVSLPVSLQIQRPVYATTTTRTSPVVISSTAGVIGVNSLGIPPNTSKIDVRYKGQVLKIGHGGVFKIPDSVPRVLNIIPNSTASSGAVVVSSPSISSIQSSSNPYQVITNTGKTCSTNTIPISFQRSRTPTILSSARIIPVNKSPQYGTPSSASNTTGLIQPSASSQITVQSSPSSSATFVLTSSTTTSVQASNNSPNITVIKLPKTSPVRIAPATATTASQLSSGFAMVKHSSSNSNYGIPSLQSAPFLSLSRSLGSPKNKPTSNSTTGTQSQRSIEKN